MSFKDLGLSEDILKAVSEAGYDKPTPIQEKAIPAILMCRDVMGLAQTGTGKTASFTLPMIDALSHGKAKARMPRSLILAPTRELAAQISESFVKYGKHKELSQALITGGTFMGEQIEKLDQGVDVLIATPGRLLDLFSRGKVILADIKILVIDEADRMLDMGFMPDLEKISSIIPQMRQTLLFSATMPKEIKKLADSFLSNPKTIEVESQNSTAANVKHYLVKLGHWKQKQSKFYEIYQQENPTGAFMFCNRKSDISNVCKFLKSKRISCEELHGDMSQDERVKSLDKFKSGDIQVLVCSDVAARGIDVQGISHVFNWDIPNNPEDYVHRIGRTGRAEARGKAFSFATDKEDKAVNNIEKIIGQPIDVFKVDTNDNAPKVSQHETRKNRNRKKDRSNRKPKDFDIEFEENDGTFGEDLPAFLK